MKRDILIENVLPHPPERVWQALTHAPTLGSWLMENDLEPTLGHAFTFRMKPQRGWDGLTHCEVLELTPQRSITFAYRGMATGEKVIACAGVASDTAKSAGKGMLAELDTTLRFTLTPEPGPGGAPHTRLRLEHRGFVGAKLVLVSFVMGMGWKKSVLPRLPRALERLAREEAATA